MKRYKNSLLLVAGLLVGFQAGAVEQSCQKKAQIGKQELSEQIRLFVQLEYRKNLLKIAQDLVTLEGNNQKDLLKKLSDKKAALEKITVNKRVMLLEAMNRFGCTIDRMGTVQFDSCQEEFNQAYKEVVEKFAEEVIKSASEIGK